MTPKKALKQGARLPPLPKPEPPPVPEHLEEPERLLWERLTRMFVFVSASELAILEEGLSARMMARHCLEHIRHDGLVTAGKIDDGPHPLAASHRQWSGVFMRAMKLLNIHDITLQKGRS